MKFTLVALTAATAALAPVLAVPARLCGREGSGDLQDLRLEQHRLPVHCRLPAVRQGVPEKGVEIKNATKNWSKANNGGDGPNTAPVEGNGNGNPTTSAAAAAAETKKDGGATHASVGAAALLVVGAVAAAL
ncbi:hypothetical protein A1Q1_07360 [Trichosporon asahii var. asahii CBS 2479]|uniref:Uncharacterized protein n=1 Tax=Trichosporon asahii var. asahii (strain ATCC 90039 / CBS 2479 / JCM 2466 / KCTC 7840 / NBRC 103889/ NCYC 2677 / UAMH 7654) TaxID=1186058 RepID=J5R9D2_TRIAS|nr:hypothetical protein A1Q1_07360 [Trichosporon asahii var. asahii CBS 2479]EJT51388.1 hypothetical protein A1Q1_07360 [Trichosporon asahii var. asahii CBS 2479]